MKCNYLLELQNNYGLKVNVLLERLIICRFHDLRKITPISPVHKLICYTFPSAENSLLKEFKGVCIYIIFIIVSFTCIIITTAHFSEYYKILKNINMY